MDNTSLFQPDLKTMIRAALSEGGWMKRAVIWRKVCSAIEARGATVDRQEVLASIRNCLDEMRADGEIEGGRAEGKFAYYRLKATDAGRNMESGGGQENTPLFRPDLKKMIHDALFEGGWMKRAVIWRKVCSAIEARGATADSQAVLRAIRKCLDEMKAEGEIEGGLAEGRHAHYRLKTLDPDPPFCVDPRSPAPAPAPPQPIQSPPVQSAMVPPANPLSTEANPPRRTGILEAKKVVGSGQESVYCYFFEAECSVAKIEGRASWPCKIGRATRDASGRLREQGAHTARSSLPIWALEIKTGDAKSLELAIHRILKYTGRHQQAGGGTEWFLTTPEMIEAIYRTLEFLRLWPI